MCGIAGLFDPAKPLAFAPHTAAAMCTLIEHRGPDDYGEFVCSFAQIGMRRLSIIDIVGGRQPMSNEDGTVRVVFNGEIYNFRELRARLEARGHVFATASDTECIVHAYQAFGVECFAMLRGMFAIAILDLARRRLILARDRLGKKPLYYTTLSNGTIAFASELKCLFAVPGFDPTLSPAAVSDFFTLGYVPGPASIFERVQKLPPAHYLELHIGGGGPQRYWQLAFEPKFEASEAELKRQLLAELEDAVRVRLVSDVPFGAFLSGGIDSSVVCALMARNLGSPLKTFSIGFNEDEFSELDDARRVARHLGTEHHELIVEANAVELLERIVWHCDEPFADASAIPTFLVADLASRHVKMVHSGDGGDELFAGYERYRKYLQLEQLRAASSVSATALRAISYLLPDSVGLRGRRIADRVSMPYPDRYLSGVAIARGADLQRLLSAEWRSNDPYQRVRAHFAGDDDAGTIKTRAPNIERILAGDIATYLVDDILVKVDRMTMARSIEARGPLLDHHLVEFAARLPVDLKIRDGVGKYLLKQVAHDLLPGAILAKRKQGFAIPLARWLRSELRELLLDTTRNPAFQRSGIFNQNGVQACVDEHLKGVRDCSETLWSVLIFDRWTRTFIDQKPRVPPPYEPVRPSEPVRRLATC